MATALLSLVLQQGGARGFLLTTPLTAAARHTSTRAARAAGGFVRPPQGLGLGLGRVNGGVRALAASAQGKDGKEQQWTLDRVRSTFIDYFGEKRVRARLACVGVSDNVCVGWGSNDEKQNKIRQQSPRRSD